MQSKWSIVAAAFIPLGFLGGILQGSIGVAIGSAIFWAVVYFFVRPKN